MRTPEELGYRAGWDFDPKTDTKPKTSNFAIEYVDGFADGRKDRNEYDEKTARIRQKRQEESRGRRILY